MAELTFSLKDLRDVDRICEEHDPETHELTAFHVRRVRDFAHQLDLLTYLRRVIRGELMVGLAARAMGDALMQQGMASLGSVRGWIEEDYEGRYDEPYSWRGAMLCHNLNRVGDEQIFAFQVMNQWWGGDADAYRAFFDLVDLAHETLFGKPYAFLEAEDA